MKYIILAVVIMVSIILLLGVVLPYLLIQRDTVTLSLGLGVMFCYCLVLLYFTKKTLEPDK
jgi:hypothetical protein